MKKLLLLFVYMLSWSINAQANFELKPTEFVSENNVFDVPGKTAKDIYESSKIWISKNYPNPSRFTISDVEDKFLQVRYFFEVQSGKTIKLKYQMSFEIKDEKVKITINNLKKSGSFNHLKFFNKEGVRIKKERFGINIEDVDDYVNDFINDYLDYVKGKDEW